MPRFCAFMTKPMLSLLRLPGKAGSIRGELSFGYHVTSKADFGVINSKR